jgi:3-methyladenine DNA glycosylase Tag
MIFAVAAMGKASAIEQDDHDTELGVSLHDDQSLFEFLILEGAQAGVQFLPSAKPGISLLII